MTSICLLRFVLLESLLMGTRCAERIIESLVLRMCEFACTESQTMSGNLVPLTAYVL